MKTTRVVKLDRELCKWLQEHASECQLLDAHEQFRLEKYDKLPPTNVLIERVIIYFRQSKSQ
jgi:hypothetical protein